MAPRGRHYIAQRQHTKQEYNLCTATSIFFLSEMIAVIELTQSELLGQYRGILWNQTSDVPGSTLITWRHRNHTHTITSVIAAKQTVINEMYAFSIKYRYSEILFRKIIIFIYSVDKALRVIKIMDLIGLDTYATVIHFFSVGLSCECYLLTLKHFSWGFMF